MEHVFPLDRPFPWRAAALVAGAVALVELTALLALAGAQVFHVHHTAAPRTPATTPARNIAKTVPLRPRSRVSVLILNGNGVSGAAGAEATQVLAHGYRRAVPADASSTYAQSVVLFRPGWQREAERLARDVGIAAATPLDVRLPRSDRGYQVVLILGTN